MGGSKNSHWLVQGYAVNVIHYVNVVLIRIIEITLRECRFGGSKNTLIITRILYIIIYEMEKRTRVFYRNWATRVSVRWFNNSLIMTHAGIIKLLKVIKMIRHFER